MSVVNFVNGKYQAVINNKLVTRTHRTQMNYVLRNAGLPELESDLVEMNAPEPVITQMPKSEFSVTERFEFIRRFVSLLALGEINSFVLTGSGGIGKTTAVLDTLKDLGLEEDLPNQPVGDYRVIRGFSTPRALYNTLYEFKDSILVLDDSDQVFKDQLGANLLKACLDDKPVRVINWNTSRDSDDGIPDRFTYTGRVIFISNLSLHQFPQAIISRSQTVDLTLTTDEKVDIIAHVFDNLDNADQHKTDVLNFVRTHAHKAKDLNIRSAVSLLVLRENFGSTWERIAEYAFCG